MTAMTLTPLAGLTVLVTRPAGQAGGLCERIAGAGGVAIGAPLLRIAAAANPEAAQALLNDQAPWDWLIFVSANAVRHAAALGDWRACTAGRTRLAAVGEATAAALAQAGLRVALAPRPPFNSEALLADPLLAEVRGQRVLIVRGAGGREHLAAELRARGAEVAYAEVYQRLPATATEFAPHLAAWADGRYDAVVVTSGEALNSLTSLLRGAGLDPRQGPALVVPGARLAALARQSGWPQVIVAEQAGDEAVLAALEQVAPARSMALAEPPAAYCRPVHHRAAHHPA